MPLLGHELSEVSDSTIQAVLGQTNLIIMIVGSHIVNLGFYFSLIDAFYRFLGLMQTGEYDRSFAPALLTQGPTTLTYL